MAFEIIGKPVKAVSRICEQWGEAEDEVREYDVYVIETDAGKYTLKKTGSKEAQIYAQYLSKESFTYRSMSACGRQRMRTGSA